MICEEKENLKNNDNLTQLTLVYIGNWESSDFMFKFFPLTYTKKDNKRNFEVDSTCVSTSIECL